MSSASAQVIEREDFGFGPYPGPELAAGQTTYIFNAPPQPATFPDILEDGDYVLATNSQQGFVNWASVDDNTTGTGYMMLVNADDNQSGEFYRQRVNLTANTTFDFIAHIVNVNSQGDFDFCTANQGGLVLPNVTLQIEDTSGTVLASLDTGDIPFDPNPQWEAYELVFATNASTTSVDAVLINNSLGGCGNDLALDDIIFRVSVTMEAFDDTITLTETESTQSAVLFVGANDTLDGNTLPGTELYFLANGSSLPPGISFDANTGQVDVAAGTPEGVFSFDYEVCETSNRFNCDIATATIIIDFPPAVIEALDDTGSVADSSIGFTSVLNVLDNDSIDGATPPEAFELSISDGSSLPPGLTFNTNTGLMGVSQGAATGVYSFDYDLCEAGDSSNCDTATVTINVTNLAGPSVCPAGTTSVAGLFHAVSATGRDNPERTIGATLPEGTTELGDNSATTFFGEVTMDLSGDADITVPEGEIITVVITRHFNSNARAEILTSIDGVNFTSLGTTGAGGSVYGAWESNILRHDEFTVPTGGARFLRMARQSGGVRTDGVFYNNQCQNLPPVITAENDETTLAPSQDIQPDVLNVVDNDTFDGLTPDVFDLSINANSSLPAELTFDLSTGVVGVSAGTPAGVYTFDYDICERDTTNCDTATVTITLEELVVTALSAAKSVAVYDPSNIGLYLIPGNDVIYTISVENTGTGDVDSDTLVLIDIMPSEVDFYNNDIDDLSGPATDPVVFSDNGSGLTFVFERDVGFSDSLTKPTEFSACNYTPLPASYDGSVRHICFNPKGAMSAGSTWSVSFRARIK